MSWLTKVSDFAGKAENFLNRIDQNTADVLRKPRAGTPSAHSVQLTRVESEASLLNETAVSEPGVASPYKQPIRSLALSSSNRSFQSRKKDDKETDELISYLNENDHPKMHSRRSSNSSHLSLPVPQLSHGMPDSSTSPIVNTTFLEIDDKAELQAQYSDTLKSLHLKESQMAVMSVKLQEAEEAVACKDAKVEKLIRENKALREGSRSWQHSSEDVPNMEGPQATEAAHLAKLEAEYKRERNDFERREAEYTKRLEKASAEKSALVNEIQKLKSSLSEMEMIKRHYTEELRLAKYNLEANKHEFDEYKQKAQKILCAKEKLLETLKQGGSKDGNSGETLVNGVELEELRCERELLKEELQQSQLVVYNLKADIQDMENRLREEQKASGAHREALLEQCHQHLSEANQYREKLERTQLEFEFLLAEMRRQEEAVDRKLAEKDVELMKLMEERKTTRKYDAGEAEQRMALMSEKLIAKQTDIERLEGEKRAIILRLERSERAYRQAEAAAIKACAIDMRETGNGTRSTSFLQKKPNDSVSIIAFKSVVNTVDLVGFRLANFMRSPVFRIFFLIYSILLHIWVFFVLFTYTPEIHPL